MMSKDFQDILHALDNSSILRTRVHAQQWKIPWEDHLVAQPESYAAVSDQNSHWSVQCRHSCRAGSSLEVLANRSQILLTPFREKQIGAHGIHPRK